MNKIQSYRKVFAIYNEANTSAPLTQRFLGNLYKLAGINEGLLHHTQIWSPIKPRTCNTANVACLGGRNNSDWVDQLYI